MRQKLPSGTFLRDKGARTSRGNLRHRVEQSEYDWRDACLLWLGTSLCPFFAKEPVVQRDPHHTGEVA
jgi:hypothetical protein